MYTSVQVKAMCATYSLAAFWLHFLSCRPPSPETFVLIKKMLVVLTVGRTTTLFSSEPSWIIVSRMRKDLT